MDLAFNRSNKESAWKTPTSEIEMDWSELDTGGKPQGEGGEEVSGVYILSENTG